MKNDKLYLHHILEAIERIKRYIQDGEDEFMKNTMIQDAVIRNIEIIGEATKNLTMDFWKNNSQIPWKDMAGIRDVLIHEYFGVDLDIVWEVSTIELSHVEPKIRELLN